MRVTYSRFETWTAPGLIHCLSWAYTLSLAYTARQKRGEMEHLSPPHRRRFIQTLGAAVPLRFRGSQDTPFRIDAGRQLFVDDYLIAETSLTRSFHKPRIHEASPVLRPETALEMNNGYCPVACPFQGGVFFDPDDH